MINANTRQVDQETFHFDFLVLRFHADMNKQTDCGEITAQEPVEWGKRFDSQRNRDEEGKKKDE